MRRGAAAADAVIVLLSSSEEEEGVGGKVKNKSSSYGDQSSANNRSSMKKKKDEEEEGEKNNNNKKFKVVGGEVVTGGKMREKKKKKASSPSSLSSSWGAAAIANSSGISCSSPSRSSFPMSRVRRLITGSESGGGDNIRTTLDAVFLINKSAELFLEVFAEDAYTCATQERKKSVSYKNLSSTVYNGKRFEFLSDFVPEKLRVEDALKAKALGEQP